MEEKNRAIHKRIGELLVERDIITEAQLKEALEVQKKQTEQGRPKRLLGEILIELGYSTEEEVINSVTTQYAVPYLPIESYEIDEELIKSVPADLIHKYVFLPVDKMGNLLTITISDIPDVGTIAAIKNALSCNVEIFVSSPSELRKTIEKYYG